MYYVTLEEFASLLRVHPRTVVRHLTGDLNPPWDRAFSSRELISLCDLAVAFDAPIYLLERVVDGKDQIMTTKELAKYLDLPIETLKSREYPMITRGHRMARYSLHEATQVHVDYYQ